MATIFSFFSCVLLHAGERGKERKNCCSTSRPTRVCVLRGKDNRAFCCTDQTNRIIVSFSLNSISLSSLSHLKSLPSASDIKSKIIKTAIVFSDSEFSRKATTDNNQHDRKSWARSNVASLYLIEFPMNLDDNDKWPFFSFPRISFP
jgi:hypothetical protein